MTYNPITYTASGGQTVFNIPFTRISDTYIRVATKLVGATNYITKSVSTDYTIVGNTVVFNIGLASGVKVRIWRSTNRASLVDFNGVNNLTSSNLGLTTTQQANIAEEVEADLGELNAVVDGIVTSVVGFDPDNVSNSYLELQGDVTDAIATVDDAVADFAAQTAQVSTNTTNITNLTNQGTLPNGYVTTPVPTYTSARVVNFNGMAAARTVDNVSNIVLTSASRNLDLNTTGANGLDTGTVANNTWYYVYLYANGYVASTTNSATTLTIAATSQKVIQLPLALRTDGSANIIPFKLTQWVGRFSELVYDVTYDFVASPSTGVTRISSAFANTSFTSVAASSFVPPLTRNANFITRTANGGGQPSFGYREATGKAETQMYAVVSSAPCINQVSNASLTASQALEFKISSSNMDIFVTGYGINL